MTRFSAVFPILLAVELTAGAELTTGNILISSGLDFNEVSEFTRDGTFVQSFDVPTLSTDPFEHNRGLIVDRFGQVHVFNGASEARISTLEPRSSTWSTWNAPQFSADFNVSFGKIVSIGDYVFATDHPNSPSNPSMGIVRLNFQDGTWTRFAEPTSPSEYAVDMTIAPSGLLYALVGPFGVERVEVYDPSTLTLVDTISIPLSTGGTVGNARDLAVDGQGRIYLNGSGTLYRLATDGQIEASSDYPFETGVVDMARSRNGDFLITDRSGGVILLDSSMNFVTRFPTVAEGSPNPFGAFVEAPVPEPATAIALLAGGSILLGRRSLRLRSPKARIQ